MAKFCTKCGKKLGFLEKNHDGMCSICFEEEERIRKEQNKQKLLNKLRRKLENGEKVYLYKYIYQQVDSIVNEKEIGKEFNISSLLELGFDGWEVIEIVPRTVGYGFMNKHHGDYTGETWGAGIGGNIAGVYIILKKELANNNSISDEELLNYIDSTLPYIQI